MSLERREAATVVSLQGGTAILVRLDAVDLGMLEKLLHDALRLRAPKRLVRETERAD